MAANDLIGSEDALWRGVILFLFRPAADNSGGAYKKKALDDDEPHLRGLRSRRCETVVKYRQGCIK